MEESRTSSIWGVLLVAVACAIAIPGVFLLWLLQDQLPDLATRALNYGAGLGALFMIYLIVRAWRRGPDQKEVVTNNNTDGTKELHYFYLSEGVEISRAFGHPNAAYTSGREGMRRLESGIPNVTTSGVYDLSDALDPGIDPEPRQAAEWD